MAIHNENRPASPLEIWRRSRGLSRADLGALAGVHRETVARYERGETNPHGKTLLALARVLGVSAEALLSLTTKDADDATDSRGSTGSEAGPG